MNNNLIECKNVSYVIEGAKIIDNVSFKVDIGNIVTIVGPNGGGKTTLLKLILGMLKPSSGKVSRARSLKIGYMPQKVVFNKQLPITVKEFILLKEELTTARLNKIIQDTKIDYLLEKQIYSVSGGELQRVLLARALIESPNLLVLDEPLQGLDVRGEEEFYRLLEELRNQKDISLLMVSHDLHTVMRSTNHVICLNRHICCQGMPDSIKEKTYDQMFNIMQSDEVIAHYQHHHNHVHDHCEDSHDSN